MRRSLALVALAVTSMVALAFLIPSALVVRDAAADRAVIRAQRRIGAVLPVVAASGDPAAVARAIAGASAGGRDRIGVTMPGGARVGQRSAVSPALIARVRDRGQALQTSVAGGPAVLQPVPVGNAGMAVVEVDVGVGRLPPGVVPAWSVMTLVAVFLVACSILAADRLGRRVVGSARRLARAAARLGSGDVTVRIRPEGPPELEEAAYAFNAMADQIAQRLTAERQFAADLSHRLRTPLTALRLNIDRLGQGPEMRKARLAMTRMEQEIDIVIKTAQRPGGEHATTTCDATEVVRDRVAFWSVLAEDQGRDWRLDGFDHPVPVPVGQGELAAALDAVLGNLFHHTPEGTEFAVTMRTGPDRVGVLVSDAGPGIADPQFALQRGRSGGGSTGLGLDIVRRLAESTGGELRIGRSALGGAQVGIWLRTTGAQRKRRRRGRGPRLRPGRPTDHTLP
ncbi:HAMP domain-containing histidine kinase [Actinoallomurus purpureus]|uniref:sensor histidine kinase n=1 Tax=Actinoallomurus purpureus TaxID=478114 RepID=UPI002093977B|nr:HAMP domain-containing sensor histidine kinase [Actinoallomurus purpureus]MCO6009444.1 HAMP domain-containing histidine kinase [Actinoallomurus purpureus]